MATSFYRTLVLMTCTALTSSLATMAWAQSAPAPTTKKPGATSTVEEVVVSATRRQTEVQRTPIAISAISANTLDKGNVNQIADLNGLVPGLTVTKQSGYETAVTIRGVGLETPENELTTSPGVALFIDGVYIANSIALDQTLFDVERIEVLRGPQGALFGQSATGGAVSIITKQPKLGEFSGMADVTLGDYALHRERGQVNIPVGDTFAVRVSAQDYAHDGFTKKLLPPYNDPDDANDWSTKAAALWKPTGNFQATLSSQYYKSDTNGSAQKNIIDPSPDPWAITQDYPSKFALETNLTHLDLELELAPFTIKSVSGFQWLNHKQQQNGSRLAYSILKAYDNVAAWNTDLQNYNEEFDIVSKPGSSLDWIVGVFASSQKTRQFVAEFGGSDANANFTVLPNIMQVTPANITFGQDLHVSHTAIAGFAQATWHITDRLRATGGFRVNHDSFTAAVYNFSGFGKSVGGFKFEDTVPTWRSEVDYDLTPDNMIYGSFTRGFKPGGLNGNPNALVIKNQFKTETNTAFEAGAKNSLFDRNLKLNVSGFYYIYKNMQYIETDPIPFNGGTANIPSVHIWGAEFEATGNLMDQRLHVTASLALEGGEIAGTYKTINSTVQNAIYATAPGCQYGGQYYNPACWNAVIAAAKNVGGKEPAKLPNVLGSLSVGYDIDAFGGTLTPRAQVIYRGSNWARIFNEPSLDKVPSYTLVNLNAEYIPAKSNFAFNVTVSNLFNKAGVNSRYTDPYGIGQTSQQFTAPRQIMGSVSYFF